MNFKKAAHVASVAFTITATSVAVVLLVRGGGFPVSSPPVVGLAVVGALCAYAQVRFPDC